VRHRILHPYRTTGRIIDLCILFFYVSRQQMRGQKFLDWMVASITHVQSPLNFLLN
jgi:hypothetical protein